MTGRWAKLVPWISTLMAIVLMVIIWKLVIAIFDVSPFVLPQPEDVLSGVRELVNSDGFWTDVRVTLTETLVGFAIALALGLGLGIVLGRVVWLEQALRPVIVASQVVPKVALIPLFIIWFGFGMTSKIIIVALLSFFPILLNVILGVRSVDTGHRDVMRSLNSTRWQTFRRLEYPSTLPYVLAGMEVGIVFAVVGAVVGEYLGGDQGLGYRIVTSLNNLQAETLFAVILVLTLFGFLLYLAVVALKRFLIPWHDSTIDRTRASTSRRRAWRSRPTPRAARRPRSRRCSAAPRCCRGWAGSSRSSTSPTRARRSRRSRSPVGARRWRSCPTRASRSPSRRILSASALGSPRRAARARRRST
jgi:NitT/TauT family transport system permease protein